MNIIKKCNGWRVTPSCPVAKKAAFTLAEVLITLGIIGVVAAITLPTLVANYKKQVYVTQLKKSVSAWEQGLQKILADEGVDSLQDADVFKSISGESCNLNSSKAECSEFFSKLSKYISVINQTTALESKYQFKYIRNGSTPIYPSNNSGTNIIFLKDGSAIFNYTFRKKMEIPYYTCEQIHLNGGKMCEVMGNITIDVNGLKGPNTAGRDIFDFNISGNGLLIPYYSDSQSIYIYGDKRNTWENQSKVCGNKGKADATTVAQYGSGCGARVISNGWVMDY
mgnify:CR=1 FL=1